MPRRSQSQNSLSRRWLASVRDRLVAPPAEPLPGGPAWRSRKVTPARISSVLGIFAALVAGSSVEAGDLLRGGAAAGARGNGNVPGTTSSAQAITQARANARDALSRTTQAVNSVKAFQDAARAAANAGANNLGRNPATGLQLPDVPNGLTPGGLQVDPGVAANPSLWSGARLPQQTNSGGKTVVNVTQTAQEAVLNWKTFNVGKQTTLTFNQDQGRDQESNWIVFNKVNDPSGVPSQILGSIQAMGQVYVINRNGIIFGGSSQINTHIFVGSSLPINTNLINAGLLNNVDAQFLFSALPIAAGQHGTDAFTPDPLPAGQIYGDVTVQPGAQLTSPSSTAHVGGRVALVGPNVTNNGTISTPDGQTILAAGLQVGINAHASSDPSLRGLDVYVGSVTDPNGVINQSSGTVTNTGMIDAPRANVTMAGKSVSQLGVINSSTSVALNGRIDLQAAYNSAVNTAFDPTNPSSGAPFFPTSTGTVVLGSGSATQILPEWSNTDRVVGTQLALPSQVNIEGQAIHFASGSTLLAPNATVNVQAGLFGSGGIFRYSGGQIYLEPDSLINVAGSTDISAPMSENMLTLQLRGNELADSPLERNSVLRGVSITIDIRQSGVFNGLAWVGTPLGDATGFVGLINRTVGELTIGGGTVNLFSGGSVVMQTGSKVDVSGGWINYQGAMVQTTRVVYGANILDISKATPDRIYSGIYTGTFTDAHPKYGISNTFASPLAPLGIHYEAAYDYGGGGGSIVIKTPAAALDGTLAGDTIAGPRQRTVMPTASSLTLSFQADTPPEFTSQFSPTPPKVVFQTNTKLDPVGPFTVDANGAPADLSLERKNQVILSPDLFTTDGFGTLTVNNGDGLITVPKNVTLNAPANGSVTLTAANVDLEGKINAPGGKVSITAYTVSPFSPIDTTIAAPAPDLTRGTVTVGASAVLNTAGLIVDDRPISGSAGTEPLVINGGAITIKGFSADLAAGSVLDVSGGVAVSATGKPTYGSGGTITIAAGNDPRIPQTLGGHLTLASTLKGFSGGTGGTLAIQAPLIQVGGSRPNPEFLWLQPEFFNQGGFATFTLTGLGAPTSQPDVFLPAITIAPGTILEPVAQSFVADLSGQMPGGGVGTVLEPTLEPVGVRKPVNLSFLSSAIKDVSTLVRRGDIVDGEGSIIRTDPLGSVTFAGGTVTILGTISAPGGTISVTGATSYPSSDSAPVTAFSTVYLGPNSALSAAGTTLLVPDAYGRRTGSILPGGTISVSGNIVARAGAVLDVSGTTGVLDLAPASIGLSASTGATLIPANSGLNAPLYSIRTVPTQVDSNGGSIVLKGAEELFSDATLLGKAGGPTALGGSLSISSSRFYAAGVTSTPADLNLMVKQSGSAFSGLAPQGVGAAVLGASGTPVTPMGYFSVSTFQSGGFDSLALGGNVQFSGPVTITAARALTVATSGVLAANAPVTLTAPYIAIGTPFTPPTTDQNGQSNQSPFYIPPTYGTANLTLNAGLIDVGNVSLQGIGQANFIADNGDIRGEGTLAIAGNLFLRAGQIYPVTSGLFVISASDYKVGAATLPGSITIAGSGTRPLPLSAGGELDIYATNITQGGVLRAPLGTINVGWDGTGTMLVNPLTGLKPAIAQTVTLTGGSITSVSAVDPTTGAGVLIPFGVNSTGTSWIDPTGTDITAGLAPQKLITVAGQKVVDQSGSVIDVRGGGDLYSYRFNQGIGGQEDILGWNFAGAWNAGTTYKQTQIVSYNGSFWYARTDGTSTSVGVAPSAGTLWKQVTQSFAIVPGYSANYAPYATFNISTDPGYPTTGLAVGDQIRLDASSGLPAGVYTLLPARYALLPGAFLVTPQSGNPIGSFEKLDGSSLVAGTRFNSLNSNRTVPNLTTTFEVAPSDVVRNRADYVNFTASTFLNERATALGINIPRLPNDAGHVVISGVQALTLDGDIYGKGAKVQDLGTGRGAEIDISSSADILIAGSGTKGAAGQVVLDATHLNSFGAESLLVGGERQDTSTGVKITVNTGNLTVDNQGSPLIGPEIILAAQKNLNLAAGAQIEQKGTVPFTGDAPQPILIGDANVSGSGDGAIFRVSSNQVAVVRSGVDSSTVPNLNVGAGTQITGDAITFDSTAGMTIDPNAKIAGANVAIDSNRISIEFNNPGALQANPGLVLTGQVLQDLLSSGVLSLTGLSSIDFYGTGNFNAGGLALHTPDLRGFNTNGSTLAFTAKNVLLDNMPGLTGPGAALPPPLSGTLQFNAATIRLGANQTSIDQYADVELNAPGGVIFQSTVTTSSLNVQGNLTITAPYIAGTNAAVESITAGGTLTVQPTAVVSQANLGLGATLALQGASVTVNSDLLLPSGLVTLHATGAGGDVTVGGRVDVGGTAVAFYDVVKYTDGGGVNLIADSGNVNLAAGSVVSVAAQPGGGNAGGIAVSAANGNFVLSGTLAGKGGAGGTSGTFSADFSPGAGTTSLSTLDSTLDAAGFLESRTYRVRTGDVSIDGLATAHTYNVSADTGSITVTGTGLIDASGNTGGTINLVANGSLTLNSGAVLTVAAKDFDNAGKGGSVTLEAGSETNGVVSNNPLGVGPQLDIQGGSKIDLSVASVDSIADPAQRAAAITAAQALGKFAGTLHLRAPQTANGLDLQISQIAGQIIDPSSVIIEGYRLFNLQQGGQITSTGSIQALGGNITSAGVNVQGSISANGALFASDANEALMASRLGIGTGSSLPDSFVVSIVPGAEVINLTGNLTLGTTSSTGAADWNFASAANRFGSKKLPGVLTLRAADNIVLLNSLTDGFNITNTTRAYQAQLLAFNALLSANAQSWSYNLAAGADLTAADFHQVQTAAALSAASYTGSLQLGKNGGLNASSNPGSQATTTSTVGNLYQVIRTGSGNIDIAAGGNVQLLNQFATIYTAGTQVQDPTMGGTFDVPKPNVVGGTGNLGSVQESPAYPALFSMAGGNVTIKAQGDIIHQTVISGQLVDDSEKELPTNWLYRRGYVDPVTGLSGKGRFENSASTSWWVDFSNFFEGVGALGGGNVTMIAGHNITNVDALIPTNARMPGYTDSTKTANAAPDASKLVELGGGDLVIKAGNDISAGVYYVERGNGVLHAGGQITTNATRSPSLGNLTAPTDILPSQTWLPTTLFLGKGTFDVSAQGDVLLGPTVNPFLLPEGFSNSVFYKTYFSTYASTDAVNVTSLGGDITFRESVTLPSNTSVGSAQPILQAWMEKVSLLSPNPLSVSAFQPWLKLNEDDLSAFDVVTALQPGTLRATAFSGDININGTLTLSPSPTGTIDLLARGGINGLQPDGAGVIAGVNSTIWNPTLINLSDASPSSIPGIASPFAYLAYLASIGSTDQLHSSAAFLSTLDATLTESGSTQGQFASFQTQQALHGTTLLHENDTTPVHIYSSSGNIADLTLFSGKATRVLSGQDITDVGLYLQNDSANDVSVISAARDIVAYNANSPLRAEATSAGNYISGSVISSNFIPLPSSGDIQISGPGTLEVLAGRNLDLGNGTNFVDGTGVGLTSIGNARNPNLGFTGADLVVAAGLGAAGDLSSNGGLQFETFVTRYLTPGSPYLAELGVRSDQLSSLSPEQKDALALQVFFLVLRDAGRNHNDPTSPDFGTYAPGFAAISQLFSTSTTSGDISTQSRDIRTKSGGAITIVAPNGALALGATTIGNPSTPPGIVTEHGGDIDIFTHNDINIGISRIFTLRGGNIIIWSSEGNIAAGSASKTVQTAPPTRVIIDPQSANVQTDLAGLATGGGIGVLATVADVPPGNVDLIAPNGAVDAGDAGIRATGNLNIAAVRVLNADNIQVSGSSAGVPAPVVPAAPNISGITQANNTAASTSSAAADTAKQQQQQVQPEEPDSNITVEIIGYGGGEGDASGASTSQ